MPRAAATTPGPHDLAVAAYRSAPTPRNATMLLAAVRPIIDDGLRAYGGKDVNPMLRSKAKQIVLEAAHRYDPARSSLKTHLLQNLQGLRRYGARQTQLVKAPEKLAIDHHRVFAAHAQLADELGRDPSTGELADRTSLSIRRITQVRKYRPGIAEGQLATDDAGGTDDPSVEAPPAVMARVEFLHHKADPRDQLILESRYGLFGQPRLSVTQTARRLNLSPSAVSQRAARLQAALDEVASIGGF